MSVHLSLDNDVSPENIFFICNNLSLHFNLTRLLNYYSDECVLNDEVGTLEVYTT